MLNLRSSFFRRLMSRLLLVVLSFSLFNIAMAEGEDDSAIRARIAPAGSVCLEGDPCVGKVPTAATNAMKPMESTKASASAKKADAVEQVAEAATTEPAKSAFNPEQVYNTKCMACHATGAAGAPKVGDAAAWSARLEKGIEKIVANAISGINAMPPKGMCMECSEEEIKAIVQYMVDKSK